MLATGNQINTLDSYSGESLSVHGGVKSVTVTGFAIINSSSPSREIAFIIPSRQKGRGARRFSIPKGAFVHSVKVQVPKDVHWDSPTQNTNAYQIGPAFNAFASIMLVDAIHPPYSNREFDYAEIAFRIPGGSCGSFSRALYTAGYNTDRQYVVTSPLADGTFTNVPILADNIQYPPNTFADNLGISGAGQQLSESWVPFLLVKPTVAAPTTFSGKKSAFILTVSYQLPDLDVPITDDLFAGIAELD